MSAERPGGAWPYLPASVDIYDTTLRDGSQQEGLSLSVDDKLRVAEQLDHLGVAYIEGGWPGANPKDDEFFRRAPKELRLGTAQLVAFGSTRRAGGSAESDSTLAQLLEADTETVCIVAKAWDWHVTEALRTSLDEARAMVQDSVAFLIRAGRRVFLDAEHFFDGYRANPDFALSILDVALEAGSEMVVLCDTNGGSLPFWAEEVSAAVRERVGDRFGVHFHNDSGCAVANSVMAVRQGARQVQGCCNGYGERTGNADLVTVIGNLSLKMGVRTIPPERLERLTAVAHHVAEIVNLPPNPQQPYVGSAAFAHKAGLHASGLARAKGAYEHVNPEAVGNGTRFVVSELAGRSTISLKAQELGIDLDSKAVGEVLAHLKDLEHAGYHFEAADASLELLLRGATGWRQDYFRLESFRVVTERRERRTEESGEPEVEMVTEATVKVHVGKERILAVAEGNGPVHALDCALRKAVEPYFDSLRRIRLTDFRVRVLDSAAGTAATTRVLIDSSDGERTWSTIGVSDNIIEASWQALADSIVYGLLLAGARAAAASDSKEKSQRGTA
jgi:2-isopropylmalate synthase